VSDGSTDGTDDIVARYTAEHPWIELLRMPERRERNFAGKVHAFNAGLARLQGLDWDIVGSLDGDISFDADYFSFLVGKLQEDASLGLVGTPFQETSGESYDYRFVNIEHVSGACQLFRRECFTAIGGYMPVKGGSIDHIAVITARMKGWKTRTFTDRVCLHHREMGTAQQSIVASRFQYGAKDYRIGNHPLWELFRTAYQMKKWPWFVGGMALGSGYLWAWMRGTERPVSGELITFHRQEQMQRLKNLLSGKRRVSESKSVTAPVRGAL
jgi:glycosyltransferase involved in cell wall biosynthesis